MGGAPALAQERRPPLLFQINLDAGGHGGKSRRHDQFREVAFDPGFLLWQLGVECAGR